MIETVARTYGVARSLATYYGPVWRRARMTAWYREFLKPGDLAFDIGAHVGNRVAAFRRAGALVVAVEPQPDFARLLRLFFGRDDEVAIEQCAVGMAAGSSVLYVSTSTPTLSTTAADWIRDVQSDSRFGVVRWNRTLPVPLVTLDTLIARHGEPQFCKIDVEGSEYDVLAGLTRPLSAVSFEYIPVAIDRATACIARLGQLGHYRYRFSRGETMRWSCADWLEPDQMLSALQAMQSLEPSGDVYARRVT